MICQISNNRISIFCSQIFVTISSFSFYSLSKNNQEMYFCILSSTLCMNFMAFPILKIVNAAKLTCVDIIQFRNCFFLMTLKTLFVMINESPDPRLMRNILLIKCLILLFNPLLLSLNCNCVHTHFLSLLLFH